MFSFIKKLFKPSLLEACEKGDIDAVKQNVTDGMDVNIKDTEGRSPLLVEAMEPLVVLKKVFKILGGLAVLFLVYGVIEGADLTGLLIGLVMILVLGSVIILFTYTIYGIFFKDYFDSKKSLHAACGYGKIQLVKKHLDSGADVNSVCKNKGTPLMHATNIEIASLLINNGAKVFYESSEWTPLHSAAHNNLSDVAELLIKKGALVNEKDETGITPLHCATEGDYEIRNSTKGDFN